MDLTVFTGPGRPLGLALLGMLAASLLGAVIGAWAPWAAYRRLREEALDEGAFDPRRELRSQVLIFQAAAMTGLPYGIVAAFLMAMLCNAFSFAGTMPPGIAAAMPRILLAVVVLGAANLAGGIGKGLLAGRQLAGIAQEPKRFGPALVFVLLPEFLMILALLFYMLSAIQA